jgi:hypothetical protein
MDLWYHFPHERDNSVIPPLLNLSASYNFTLDEYLKILGVKAKKRVSGRLKLLLF